MKTDYSEEIKNLISNNFKPSSSEEEKEEAKTLKEIQTMVTSVLPAKWIDETDVFEALQTLGFTTSYGCKVTGYNETKGLYYFITEKS